MTPRVVAWVLTDIFIVLKLAGVGVVAGWSWWLVLSPVLLLTTVWLLILATGCILRWVEETVIPWWDARKRKAKK